MVQPSLPSVIVPCVAPRTPFLASCGKTMFTSCPPYSLVTSGHGSTSPG